MYLNIITIKRVMYINIITIKRVMYINIITIKRAMYINIITIQRAMYMIRIRAIKNTSCLSPLVLEEPLPMSWGRY